MDDAQTIGYENRLYSILAMPFFLCAGLINFILRYFMLHHMLLSVLQDSTIFILLGIAFIILIKIRFNAKHMEHILSALSGYAFLFITVAFYAMIGASIWIFGAILLIFAMGRNTRVMLSYMTVSLIASGIFIIFTYANMVVNPGSTYHIIQFCFLMILLLVSAAVHHLNIRRRQKVRMQIAEINKTRRRKKEGRRRKYSAGAL